MRLCLKVDVDTHRGLKEGVPALQALLEREGVKAAFFVPLGPDHSGRAVFRVFRQPGFLAKMVRTKAPSLYGFPTILYGTLWPAPKLAQAARNLLPSLAAAGHEVGLHGFDHVKWHDRLQVMARQEVAREIVQAQRAFREIMGRPATAFAAPGWQDSRTAREILLEAGMGYTSNTRGSTPYFPRYGSWVSPLLEIPTTLPTLDELLGWHGCTARDFYDLVLGRLQPGVTQVLTVHAEWEGGPFLKEFAGFLERGRARGVIFARPGDWARELLARPEKIPAAPVSQGRVPGRAGTVSCQGKVGEGP